MELSKWRKNLTIVLVGIAEGLVYFIPYIRMTFYDQTVSALGLTNAQMGGLGDIYGIAAIPCYFLSGIFTQKYQCKNLMAVGLIGTAALGFWHATFPSYSILLLIHVLYAVFGITFFWSPYITILRALGPDSEQGRIYSINTAIKYGSTALFGFFFLWIFSLFVNELGGYRMMIIISCVVYILFGIAGLIIYPKVQIEEKDKPKEKKDGSKLKDLVAALKLPGTWLMAIFVFTCTVMINASRSYFGTYSTQILHTTKALSSALQIIRQYLLSVGLTLLAGFIADRFKFRTHFMIIIIGASTIFNFVMPFMHNFMWPAIILTTIIMGFNMCMRATYFSVMDEALIPRKLTAASSGIYSTIAYLPDAFLGVMVGTWLDRNAVTGFNKLYIFMGICGVIAIATAFIMNKRFLKKTEGQKAD